MKEIDIQIIVGTGVLLMLFAAAAGVVDYLRAKKDSKLKVETPGGKRGATMAIPTVADVLAEPAGRRLDGWIWWYVFEWLNDPIDEYVPAYSTCWDVAGVLLGRGFEVGYYPALYDGVDHGIWEARFVGDGFPHTAHGDTGPHAIARAVVLDALSRGTS